MSAPVRVHLTGATGAELDRQVVDLRRVLRSARLPAVRAVAPAPEGAKADAGVVLGVLTVTLGPALEMLPGLLAEIRGWVHRSPDRRVTITLDGDSLDVTGVSAADQSRLVEAFLARHGPTPPAAR